MWTMRRKLVVVAVIGSIALAGCGSVSSQPTSTAADGSNLGSTTADGSNLLRLAPAAGANSCVVNLQGHDVTVQFSSDTLTVEPECTNWEHVLARGGELWSESPRSSTYPLNTICSLEDPQGSVAALVQDVDPANYGQEACTSLLSAGWNEH
jgi:uncharacterized protein YceK